MRTTQLPQKEFNKRLEELTSELSKLDNAIKIIKKLNTAFKSNDDEQKESTKRELEDYIGKLTNLFKKTIKLIPFTHLIYLNRQPLNPNDEDNATRVNNVLEQISTYLYKISIYLYNNNERKLKKDISQNPNFPFTIENRTYKFLANFSSFNTIPLIGDLINKKFEEQWNNPTKPDLIIDPLEAISDILNEDIIIPAKNWKDKYEVQPQFTPRTKNGTLNAPLETVKNISNFVDVADQFIFFQGKFDWQTNIGFQPPDINNMLKRAEEDNEIYFSRPKDAHPDLFETYKKIAINKEKIKGIENNVEDIENIIEGINIAIGEIVKISQNMVIRSYTEAITKEVKDSKQVPPASVNRSYQYPNEEKKAYYDRTQKDHEILTKFDANAKKSLENVKSILVDKKKELNNQIAALNGIKTQLAAELKFIGAKLPEEEKKARLNEVDEFYKLQGKLPKGFSSKNDSPLLEELKKLEQSASYSLEESANYIGPKKDPEQIAAKRKFNEILAFRYMVTLFDLYQEKIKNKTFDKTKDSELRDLLKEVNILTKQGDDNYTPNDTKLKSLEVYYPTTFQYQKFRNLVSKSKKEVNNDEINKILKNIDTVYEKRLSGEIKEDRDALRIFEQAVIDAYYEIRRLENSSVSEERDASKKIGNLIEKFIKAESGLDLIAKYGINIPHKIEKGCDLYLVSSNLPFRESRQSILGLYKDEEKNEFFYHKDTTKKQYLKFLDEEQKKLLIDKFDQEVAKGEIVKCTTPEITKSVLKETSERGHTLGAYENSPTLPTSKDEQISKKIALVHSSCFRDNHQKFNVEIANKFIDKLKFEYDKVIFWGPSPTEEISKELDKLKSIKKFDTKNKEYKFEDVVDENNLKPESDYRKFEVASFKKVNVNDKFTLTTQTPNLRPKRENTLLLEASDPKKDPKDKSEPIWAFENKQPLEYVNENPNPNNLSRVHFQDLTLALQKYINMRRKEANKSGNSYLNFSIYGRLRGFSAEVKISAAERLINHINDSIYSPRLDDRDLAALQDGVLGSIVSHYRQAYKNDLPIELQKPNVVEYVSELMLSK